MLPCGVVTAWRFIISIVIQQVQQRHAVDICSHFMQEAWHLDIMVNAAGMGWAMPLLDTPIESFRAHHETNVVGVLRLTQLMRKLTTPMPTRPGRHWLVLCGIG